MAMQSEVDHSVSPPRITIPRDYNAAADLIDRNLRTGRAVRLRVTTTTRRIPTPNSPNASTASPAHSSRWGCKWSSECCCASTTRSTSRPASSAASRLASFRSRPIPCSRPPTTDTCCMIAVQSRSSYPRHCCRRSPFARKSPFLKHVIVSGADARAFVAIGFVARQAPSNHEDNLRRRVLWLYSSGSTGAPRAPFTCIQATSTAELYTADPRHPQNDVVSLGKTLFAYGLTR